MYLLMYIKKSAVNIFISDIKYRVQHVMGDQHQDFYQEWNLLEEQFQQIFVDGSADFSGVSENLVLRC